MKYFRNYLLLILAAFLITGCSSTDQSQEQEHPNVAVTQWTEKMEIFMEYPVPVKNEPGKFIIHLTKLSDFRAVTEGSVTLKFKHQNGETIVEKTDRLLREGIFNPIIKLPYSGSYDFSIEYSGAEVSDLFDIGTIEVFESLAQISSPDEEEESGISFLKEQQWKIDFKTELARPMPIRPSVTALAEVIPKQNAYAEIVSPVDGILKVQENENLLIPGALVRKGQLVAVLAPPLQAANSWVERYLSLQQAKREYERAQRLLEKQSISQRDFENIQQNYFIQKAGYESLIGKNTAETELDFDLNNSHFHLKAPINGIVNDVAVLPGQQIAAGTKMMTIVDPAYVWLRVNVFEKDYYKIRHPQGAALTLPGIDSLIILPPKELRLLNMGNILNKETQTIAILFELKNDDRLFKIGQRLQLQLYTDFEQSALCVPQAAVFDDNNQDIVFVHVAGETFEKRFVKTGAPYLNWIQILDGINEGDRVVSQGGYQVKLASTSEVIGHAHTH